MVDHEHLTPERFRVIMNSPDIKTPDDVMDTLEPYRLCVQCLELVQKLSAPQAFQMILDDPVQAKKILDSAMSTVHRREAQKN